MDEILQLSITRRNVQLNTVCSVCLCFCYPSVNPFIRSYVVLCVVLSVVWSSFRPSVGLMCVVLSVVWSCGHLSARLSVCLSVMCLSFCRAVHLSVSCPVVWSSFRPAVRVSVCRAFLFRSVCLSVCLWCCLSVSHAVCVTPMIHQRRLSVHLYCCLSVSHAVCVTPTQQNDTSKKTVCPSVLLSVCLLCCLCHTNPTEWYIKKIPISLHVSHFW